LAYPAGFKVVRLEKVLCSKSLSTLGQTAGGVRVLQAYIDINALLLPQLDCFTWRGREETRNHEIQRTMKHQAPKPKRAGTYVRWSPKQPLFSIAWQIAGIRKYAKQHGLEIVRIHSDGAKGGAKQ